MNEDNRFELILEGTPTRRELKAHLDRIAMPADAKVLMAKLLETTAEVAGKIIEIGRQIIGLVLELTQRFPNTTLGIVVGLVISTLVASIPLFGMILGPLVGPLLLAFTITSGALADMKNSALAKQIDLFSAKLDAVIARG